MPRAALTTRPRPSSWHEEARILAPSGKARLSVQTVGFLACYLLESISMPMCAGAKTQQDFGPAVPENLPLSQSSAALISNRRPRPLSWQSTVCRFQSPNPRVGRSVLGVGGGAKLKGNSLLCLKVVLCFVFRWDTGGKSRHHQPIRRVSGAAPGGGRKARMLSPVPGL
jgi:hypothetical protein